MAQSKRSRRCYRTRVVLDIEGNQREVIDALGRVVMRYDYDMLGNRIHSTSMEAGERWMLNDVAGQPIRAWDARGHAFRTEYDQLHRPVRQFVRGTDAQESDPRVLDREVLFGKIEYGEEQADDVALNLRTRPFKSYDDAGVVSSEEYDFKGNLLRGTRQLAADYKGIPDWAATVDSGTGSIREQHNLRRPEPADEPRSPDNSEINRPTTKPICWSRSRSGCAARAEWTSLRHRHRLQRQRAAASGSNTAMEFKQPTTTIR